MNTKLKTMAERAISKVKPLKGYELGVLDAAIREETGELVVILLDGRKMVYVIKEINMRAGLPMPRMVNHQSIPAPTAKDDDGAGSPGPTGKAGAGKKKE